MDNRAQEVQKCVNSSDDFAIRRATIHDAEFITECTLELAVETEDDFLDFNKTLEFTKSCFEYPDSMTFWIASISGKDVAFA